MGNIFLMYHELRATSRTLCQPEPGYARYCISMRAFAAQLTSLARLGYQGCNVSEALDPGRADQRLLAITFDDGAETDLIGAAPLLKQHAFNATFFVVSGWVGRKGFLSAAQLRELHGLGFEIGAHSRTHAYLADLSADQLQTEIAQSKEELEQLLGAAVLHFSCPGGRWSPHVAALARSAGYRSVSTSRVGMNAPHTDPFRLARIAVLSNMQRREFERICRGERLWLKRAQSKLLGGAKSALGNGLYEKVRNAVMSR